METNDYLVHRDLPLERGSVLRVEDGREMLVCARDGCVWITQERDRRDVVLKAGQSFRITRSGCTLILALRGSVIALASPYQEAFAQRIELVLAGAAHALPVYESGHGLRGAVAALGTRLMKTWVGLYAAPPRRAEYPL